jgi:hypothetical protein
MRIVRSFGLVLIILSVVALASDNKLGIHQVSRVSFSTSVRVGPSVLPAGEYVVRHTMVGEDHVMAFERVGSKDVFKVKCTLVPLEKKADKDQSVFEVTGNDRVLQELVFRGDTAKHVFESR